MSKSNKIWTKEDLTIAYYIAKWDYSGLGINEDGLVEVIGNTTKASLLKQTANFRFILGIDGYKLNGSSKNKKVLADELQNKTITQVRKIVLDAIESSDYDVQKAEGTRTNTIIKKRTDKLNEESEQAFQNKLKALRKHQNLKPIQK